MPVSLTIRQIDEDLERRLRLRAARHGVSIEEEARTILASAVTDPGSPAQGNVADAIAAIMDPLGGVDLLLPPRMPHPWQAA